jgi:hypothetical protein
MLLSQFIDEEAEPKKINRLAQVEKSPLRYLSCEFKPFSLTKPPVWTNTIGSSGPSLLGL